MYVAIDKATAVRMYDLVEAEWARYLAELEDRLAGTPELERPHLESLIEFMRGTDMAVVVSQAQNEVADMAAAGLDIAKHRKRIVNEDLDSKFKDPDDPFRLVFVCAMWLTGFDSPSTSSVYLDKPMRNHLLMQTIARANRVFPDKDNGLIVDYVGVFRNLEKALAIYGADRTASGVDSPIRPKDDLIVELDAALTEVTEFCDANDIDLADMEAAQGFEFVALQKAAVEALRIDEQTRRRYVSLARRVRKTFKALLPDPEALAVTHRVAVIRSIASKIESSSEAPDISRVVDSVSDLLDRSVGAREYIIRSASGADPLIDLNQLDFEQLALRFAVNKRTAANAIEKNIDQRLDDAVRKNPTRLELAERFRRLIDEYNAGTHNLEEFLRRLKAINDELTDKEQRAVREDATEAELAIFDLLTKPEPEVTKAEAIKVKGAAKKLLAHIEEKLVLDWKRRQQTRSAVRVAIGTVLDAELPEVYGPELFDRKVDTIFDHIYASYFDQRCKRLRHPRCQRRNGVRLWRRCRQPRKRSATICWLTFAPIPSCARGSWRRSSAQAPPGPAPPSNSLIHDETRAVEYKQTARWNVREERRDKTIEQVVVKTVNGMLNDRGGTLLIGVTDGGEPVGLDDDYAQVKPPNADGYVNWLDTLFENNLGHSGANRLTIRIDQIDSHDVCRIDVPASSRPIWVKDKNGPNTLYQRRNNSTRPIPPSEVEAFIAERFGSRQTS